MMRTMVKRVFSAIASGDKSAAETAYKEAVPVLDHMARKGLTHKNKAARSTSSLNRQARPRGERIRVVPVILGKIFCVSGGSQVSCRV